MIPATGAAISSKDSTVTVGTWLRSGSGWAGSTTRRLASRSARTNATMPSPPASRAKTQTRPATGLARRPVRQGSARFRNRQPNQR